MTTFKKIYYWSIFPLFAFPLFKEAMTMKFFALFALLSVINHFINPSKKEHLKDYLFHSLPLAIMVVTSLFYLSSVDTFKEINHALLFLAMPLVFYLADSQLFTKKKVLSYLHFMCYASSLLIILYLLLFIMEYPVYDLFRTKYNSSFFRDFVYDKTVFFTIHPAYFSIVLVFLTAFSLEQLKKQFKVKYLIFISFFYVFTFLLLTKLNILLINVLLLYAFLFYFKWSNCLKFIAIFGCLLAGYFLITNTPAMLLRVEEMYESLFTKPEGVAFDSTNIRRAVYTCDISLLKNHFLTGIGFAEIKHQLLTCFESNYQSTFYKDHYYLTHNYFLYFWLGSGIFGFLTFLYYFLKVAYQMLFYKSLAFTTFIISMFLMLNIEDYFYRQNGLFFFLLIVLMTQKANKKTHLSASA